MKPQRTVDDVLEEIPDPGDDLPNHDVPNIQSKTVERIAATEQGGRLWESYETNRRLVADEPSYTIIGKDWKYAHPTEDRPITVRERAALQTFPLDYEFIGGVADQRQQTADSVPPKLAECLADSLSD